MNTVAVIVLMSMVGSSTTTSISINATSFFLRATDLNADGNKTFEFLQPMLLYVSRHDANQKYDKYIRFVDEKSGIFNTAWGAAQSNVVGGTKKPVFPDGKTSITIQNMNERTFDDTGLPAVFYFVDASLGALVYEATESIEKRRIPEGENMTVTVMSASMTISLFDFKFNKGSSLRLTAGGAAEVESDEYELITFDNSVMDSNSWANIPLPIVTVTSNDMDEYQMSVSTKQAERSQAPVGVRTLVMSPGFPFDTIPSFSHKYSFQMETTADVYIEYVGNLRLTSSSLEVIGSGKDGKQTYLQEYTNESWKTRSSNASFFAQTIAVNIKHATGTQPGVLIRIYTQASGSIFSFYAILVLIAAHLNI